MPLNPGIKLGRYEVRSQLGAGGMGEVYLARDVEIGRDVAVKVLPSTFSTDADRLKRFQQEACAAGALNHPNILSIYDVGRYDGAPYVVSELLEGETLRNRIAGSPLNQRRAIDYALQIANGLAAAHEKGIIHRDLKPDNIFITNDGRVKILDFGLAKLTQLDGSQSQTEIPTRRVDTEPGVVMGTVGYMSPEQVRGQLVDHRSDIFAFGAILYEMLSGKRAFHGQSAADMMSAILKEDPPDLSDTNNAISPTLERLVNHCLEKSPEARFHSARDLAFALETISGSSGSSADKTLTTIAPLPPSRISAARLPWIISAILGFGLIAALPFAIMYFWRPASTTSAAVSRFNIPLPDKTRIIGPPVLSPDGRQLVFRLNTDDGKELLWLRAMDAVDLRPLNGTDGGTHPFWSPDSRSIGFFAGGKIKRVDLSGGPPQPLCDAVTNLGGTWGRNGVIVFAQDQTDGLYRVPASGGASVRITEVDSSRKELGHAWPYFLPDGEHFLYLARSTQPENSAIYVGSLDSKERKQLLKAHSSMAFAPPNFLLFVREETLMAQEFDADTLELTGGQFIVSEETTRNPINGRAFFSVSQNGVLAVRTGDLVLNQLTWFDRTGKALGSISPPGNHSAPALSPDEKKVVVGKVDFATTTSSDLWVIDLERQTTTRLTFDQANERAPAWSPDGNYIAFSATREGLTSLSRRLSNGAGAEEPLLTSSEAKLAVDWSSDSRFMLYGQLNAGTIWDLYVLPLTGEGKAQPIAQTKFVEIQGRFSPDSRWVAYSSNESGQFQVYVQSFPSNGSKWPISIKGGSQPRWRGDGRELYYFTPERELMAVEVNAESGTLKVGIPQPLFQFRVGGAGVDLGFPGSGYYTVTRDGKRFLVTSTSELGEKQQVSVVINWASNLRR